ncbi:MAG: DinB family protein [Ornithinimicrobium sp.]
MTEQPPAGETHLDEQGRPEPPLHASEIDTLTGFLDFQRATLEWRCRDLSDEQLRTALHPTSMTLGGLLKHLALVEDDWFTANVGQQSMPEPWVSVDWEADGDWEWHSATHDTGDDLRALWQRAVERSRAVVQSRLAEDPAGALDRCSPASGGREVSMRWVLVHMIEEYARHNGHADLLRESIDGQTGE